MPLSFLASRPSSMTIFAFFSCGFCTKEKIFFDFFREKKRFGRQGALKRGSSFPKRLFVRFPQAFQNPAYLTPLFSFYKTRKEFPASKKSAKKPTFPKQGYANEILKKLRKTVAARGKKSVLFFESKAVRVSRQNSFRPSLRSPASKPLLFRLPTQKRSLTVKRRPFGIARRLFPTFPPMIFIAALL